MIRVLRSNGTEAARQERGAACPLTDSESLVVDVTATAAQGRQSALPLSAPRSLWRTQPNREANCAAANPLVAESKGAQKKVAPW
jgi:hypothetical protein